MKQKIFDALKTRFGLEEFRSPQFEIISAILSGRDTLAIMPTGGGKSLCYQLPALILDGVTIVVSPLIALMKDQVDALKSKSIEAAFINSTQSHQEQFEIINAMRMGQIKLVYIAPERFKANSFVRALNDIKVSLFAIDEAHCISQWGHDFRPDYLKLSGAIESLNHPVCAAFTATATPEAKSDILTQLKMQNPKVFVSGFARPNLSFNVSQVSSRDQKDARIRDLIKTYKTGIIYCATRKSVEYVSTGLKLDNIKHVIYHGAMSANERNDAQNEFVSGNIDIAVATNAFGMGIDRPDIRFVCHNELTGSVEAFYQEAGRAGRDGKNSHCEMLFSYADKRVQDFFIAGANPELSEIREIFSKLCEHSDSDGMLNLSIEEIAELVNSGRRKKLSSSMSVTSALKLLKKYEFIERIDEPLSRIKTTKVLDKNLPLSKIIFPIGMLEEKKRRDNQKLKDLLAFAYSKECRQKWILNYFGDENAFECGICDVCKSQNISRTFEPLSDSESENVIKALSGIARMSRRIAPRNWEAKFGKDRIIKCLCGSKDAKILEFNLDKISTYGILKNEGKAFVTELIDSIIDANLAEISGADYPLLGLTLEGVKVMFKESEARLKYPNKSHKILKKNSRLSVDNSSLISDNQLTTDAELFKRMAALRDQMRRARNVPAYQIFPNKVLESLSRIMPETKEQAMLIKGIGEQKAATILHDFLDLIADYKKHKD